MPRIQCAYGFSCASMMLQPGLTAEDCPNQEVCGTIRSLTEEERAELQMARIEGNRRIIESVKVSPSYAARILLNCRGLPQSSDSLGIAESIAQLKQKIAEIEERVEQTTDLYVAPPAVEAHRYSVKRPSAEYFYNKLASPKPIFPPQVKDTKVKALHLSHDTDARNISARLGIERRNQLLALKTQIDNATEVLDRSLSKVSEDLAELALAEKLAK